MSRARSMVVTLVAAIGAVGLLVALFATFVAWRVSDEIDRAGNECGPDELHDPPPPDRYGTADELCARGDSPNSGEYYHGKFPSDSEMQERVVGGAPARFSGYTAWIDRVSLVEASRFVDASEYVEGAYVRIEVRVFNRDFDQQGLAPSAFAAWRADEGFRGPDVVGADDEFDRAYRLPGGATVDGAVYLYVGEPRGDVFVRFNPDGNETIAVWQILDDGRPIAPTHIPAA